jgi:hypothetical protein
MRGHVERGGTLGFRHRRNRLGRGNQLRSLFAAKLGHSRTSDSVVCSGRLFVTRCAFSGALTTIASSAAPAASAATFDCSFGRGPFSGRSFAANPAVRWCRFPYSSVLPFFSRRGGLRLPALLSLGPLTAWRTLTLLCAFLRFATLLALFCADLTFWPFVPRSLAATLLAPPALTRASPAALP